MTSEQRLDRLERIAKLMASAGLRARNQFREQIREHDERIKILINAQIRADEAFARLLDAQADTSRELKKFIKKVDQGRFGQPG